MPIELPLGLKHVLESGECVLFIGAGVGSHMLNQAGESAPDGKALASELAASFNIETTSTDLSKIAQVVEKRKDRDALNTFLQKRLANLKPDETYKWLFTRRWKAIFTTNYDSCIQTAYSLIDKPEQNPVTITSTSDIVEHDPRIDIPIYHLHGALFGGSTGVIITEDDYIKFRERRRMLFELLKQAFTTTPILYIGYRNEDPNWKLVLDELAEEFYPSSPPVSYRLSRNPDPLDIEILKAKGIETITGTIQEFVDIASVVTQKNDNNSERYRKIQSQVPPDLLDHFDKSPAAVTRLLESWMYVKNANFNEKPNTASFLGGDRPNWSLINEKDHFERDSEEDIFDTVLDYVTSAHKSPFVNLVLAPAGYGITTLLMSLAVKLIKEGVSQVFMHKLGNPLNAGDIYFAATLTKAPSIFIIDDAIDNIYDIETAITQLKGNGIPAIFVLGERLNEWRQRRTKVTGKEFIAESLSDKEINLLLDCLQKHSALDRLEPLKRELQVAVIKEKHGKELLVVMKEATSDKRFDAILEDEFRSIDDPFLQSVYLIVSCLFQHGAYGRDSVVADILGTTLTEMYEKIKDSLDGVVIFECINESKGIYAARTRHRIVATTIWERCSESGEKSRILQSALSHLNLNFGADANAFERMIRSDRLIDGIKDFEDKVKFFEIACKKDPDSPYVRQHYARMLSRENYIELALSQIEKGLAAPSPPRVLFHTKGVILSALAFDIRNSESIARRKMVQAEEVFRKSLAHNRRDEYSYQGLASLYIGWAKRTSSEEAAEYIAKAEIVISEGLKSVKSKDGLWILTAEVEKFLGDSPASLKALEAAVTSTPHTVIGRYLLGRAYRRGGEYVKAKTILEPVIKSNIEEFRAFIEYSLAILEGGQSIKEAIAILNISTTFGLSDARFIATLGGLLFLDGNFDAARDIFQESIKRELPYDEVHAVHFRPKLPPDCKPFQLSGRVVAVRPRYVKIETEGYPVFVCHASKWAGVQLAEGQVVGFCIEFSARGPVALNLSP